MRPSTTPADDTDARVPLSATTGYVLAVLVLLASLGLVALYWRNAHARELKAAEADFIARSQETTALLVQRLDDYELVTRGGVSLFASVARPSRRQWQGYVDGLNIRTRFPALAGLGFATYATPGQMSDLQRLLRDSGEGLFSVWPHGMREYYGAILYLDPKTPDNLAAIGYDMYSEPVRHAAMEAARDTGEPRMSGRVELVQDQGKPLSAAVLFLPVYRSGDRPSSIAARRESMQGWVYVPFRVQAFVDTAQRKAAHPLALRIVDVTGGIEQPLYPDVAPEQADTPAFTSNATLEAYGRRWRLEYRSASQATIEARMTDLRTTLAVGVFASLLLFGIALVLARTQLRAERLAARMTESYRRSELRFRSAMEYSAIGKALLDHDGHIVDANPSLARILGKPREQLLGTSFDGHFLDHPDASGRDRERDVLATAGVYRSTRTLLREEGGLRHMQLTYAPVPGDVGQDITRLAQVEDVTDRLRAEAQVLALNRTLEARVEQRTRELTIANQELESFAYSVSHDLRAPLRAIDGFSRLLEERYGEVLQAEGRDYLARVRNAAARMGTLIESLLKMARLGRAAVKPAPLDLSRMAADIVTELRADDPGREVVVEIAPMLQATGDPSLVRNLLQNLIGNAWKFTRDCAVARVEVGRDADGAFFVRDNGAGFAPEYVDKLFRPFQRLHTQEQFAGDGIGLASVKRIVERHGGTIQAEGAPGQGATFRFTLPETDAALAGKA
ncbi:CHASE domain-containing protein [Luteimonas sp. 50]|uniref:histidine kinase n=1 Tax=Cognatiluteimonas sedimenti TaxID=2927791 RepID=A0ABT0A1K5_9GAMM|nr:CHASE domain-containing protein [Lysobacter sedimenti]MCJ0824857.1 CHASE domain-containing protein [Lysobacter sedimenti]